ncbi:MAG: hypothetical protein ACYC92_14265 [Candidatus Acidiferrales bacterium]
MSAGLVSAERFQSFNSLVNFHEDPEVPTILVASVDPASLAELFEPYSLNAVWVKGLAAAKTWLATGKIAACLCSFSLEDGSYRELVKQAKHESSQIPVVIVSTPGSANEYREYLSAMNAGAFDFLCYPYRRLELERILRSAITTHARTSR